MGWKDAPVVDGDSGSRGGGGWKDAPETSFLDRAGRYARNIVDQAASGLTLGFSDEMSAAVDAAAKSVGLDLTGSSDAPTFGQRYNENLAAERGRSAQFQRDNPVAATAANIGGGVLGAANLPSRLFMGATLPATMAKGAGVGGVMGGATAFGEGTGGFEQRAKAVPIGAGVGAVAGGLIPVGVAGVAAGFNKAAPPVLRKIADTADNMAPKVEPRSLSAAGDGGTVTQDGIAARIADSARGAAESIEGNAAISRLAREMERSGGVDVARRRLAELGDDAFIADTTEGAKRLANLGYIMPGEAPDKYKKAFTERAGRSPQRMVSAFEGSEPTPSTFELLGEGKAFDQNLRAVGQRVYGEMEEAGLRQTPELMEIYTNPHVAAAIDGVMAVEQSTRIGTSRAPASPVEIMHKVKQAIWDMGFDKDTARPGPNASFFRDLGVQYMDRLKAANPALREADRAYSQAASLPDYFDAGRGFLAGGSGEAGMNASSSRLGDLLATADPQQTLATRWGATNAVREKIGVLGAPAKATSLGRDLALGGDELTARLTQLYGPERAQEIMRTGRATAQFADTAQTVIGGSPTTQRAVSVADDISIPSGGSPTPFSLIHGLVSQYNKLRQPSEAMRGRLADILANPDAVANAETLALVDAMIKAPSRGRAMSSGAAGGAGGQTPSLMSSP